jgi:hypothetical protein
MRTEASGIIVLKTVKDSFEVIRNRRRQDVIEVIRRLAQPLPPGYKFNRDEIYDRAMQPPQRESE